METDTKAIENILVALLSNVDVLIYALSAMGTIFSVFGATKTGQIIFQWWAEQKTASYGKAISFLEAGVTEVYHTVYKELKADANHKITVDEAKRLRDIAIEAAIGFSKREFGRDIVTSNIGATRLDAAIENIVGELKNKNATPKQTQELKVSGTESQTVNVAMTQPQVNSPQI